MRGSKQAKSTVQNRNLNVGKAAPKKSGAPFS